MRMLGGTFRRQRSDPTDTAHALESAVDGNQTRRIVATIFQPPQTFEQDGNDVTLRNRADNATHVSTPFFLFDRSLPAVNSD